MVYGISFRKVAGLIKLITVFINIIRRSLELAS
jgi:hypothetical protein